jgi:signal transduction histidine kinase
MTAGRAAGGSRLVGATYRVFVVVYLGGLVVWLLLGVVAPMAQLVPPLHSTLASIGGGRGPAADIASRITEHAVPGGTAVWVAYLFSLMNLGLGVLLMVKRPDDLVPRLLALAFMGTAATFNEPSHQAFHVLGDPPLIEVSHFSFHVLSGCAYLWAVVLFPDGRLLVRWPASAPLRRLAAVAATVLVAVICWRSSFIAHPPFFVVFFGILIPVVGIAAQSVQLRSHHAAAAVEQSRLLRVALLPALMVALVWLTAHAFDAVGSSGEVGRRVELDAMGVFPAAFAVVPVMMCLAIVRHHLWGIDLVASRTLLMAVLLTLVSLLYVTVVAFTGLVLQGRGWAVLVPLVIVACAAEPVRERCQAICNRLVFGQRTSPREALRSLVDRFAGGADTDELTELTRMVVRSTRAARCEIWLLTSDGLALLAEQPPTGQQRARIALPAPTLEACSTALQPADVRPVGYQGQLLAVISLSTPRGVSLTARESRLVGDLSRHAGLVVANAKLTIDLERELAIVATRAAELGESRRDVVLAQDRQRRRLERDIHDGAQQQLVAFLITLTAARGRAGSDHLPGALLDDVRTALTATQRTVAQLSSGGAPTVLTESGLRAALEAVADDISRAGPAVHIDVRTEVAGTDVATAVYFCCLEAVQNAVKHAAATSIRIRVESDGGRLTFSVADDGRGFDRRAVTAGSGLANLDLRLRSLGGDVVIETAPGSGTTVRGQVPLAQRMSEPCRAESATSARTP